MQANVGATSCLPCPDYSFAHFNGSSGGSRQTLKTKAAAAAAGARCADMAGCRHLALVTMSQHVRTLADLASLGSTLFAQRRHHWPLNAPPAGCIACYYGEPKVVAGKIQGKLGFWWGDMPQELAPESTGESERPATSLISTCAHAECEAYAQLECRVSCGCLATAGGTQRLCPGH